MSTLIIIGCVILGGIFVLFPQARALAGAFIGLFIQDASKTVKGAEAIFSKAIEEAQEEYTKAAKTLEQIAGSLDTQKRAKQAGENRLAEMEKKCEMLARSGDRDHLAVYAGERQIILQQVSDYTSRIADLEIAQKDAREMVAIFESKVKQLKLEKERAITDLKLNKQLANAYSSLDELRRQTGMDKLLASAKEGAVQAREQAVGAKIVHESRNSTILDNADKQAQKLVTDSYVDDLLKKYNHS